MSSKLRHIAAFSGTTILGDGSVIMIVDPNGIAQALGRAAPVAPGRRRRGREGRGAAADEDLTPLLVFRAGSQQPKAVPLSLVSRLEEIDCRRIEISDGRHLVQYRDQLMPLVAHRRRDRHQARRRPADPGILRSGPLDGPRRRRDRRHRRGRLDIEVASNRPGVLGYAVVKGSATEIVDVGHYLPQAFDDWFRRRDEPASAGRRARCCWSTTRRSSATCWRR